MSKVNILGTDYEIQVKKYDEDSAFERRGIDGYCDSFTKKMVICDLSSRKEWEHEESEAITVAQKHTLRHEIVHAFLYESGLAESALSYESAWAINEEMIDWVARQGTKIYEAWKATECI